MYQREVSAASSFSAYHSDFGALSPIHQNIKEEIVRATELDTVHIFRTLRNTSRVFANTVAKEVVAIERRPGGAKFEDIRDLVSGARGRLVYTEGDKDKGVWTVGLSAGLIHDIPSCEELLRRMERDAEGILDAMSRRVIQSKL